MQQRRRKKQGSASAERIQKAYSERNYEIEVIPPKEEFVFDNTNKVLRVAAYCRVSTEEESQESSYVLQVENYVEFIKHVVAVLLKLREMLKKMKKIDCGANFTACRKECFNSILTAAKGRITLEY